MEKANEKVMAGKPAAQALADRKLFVRNLGWLLSQTRQRIESCALSDDGIIIVKYPNGRIWRFEIGDDSYLDIIRYIVNRI